MSQTEGKRRGKRFLPSAIITVVLAVLVAWLRGVGISRTAAENCGALSDAFFVTGTLVGGIGILAWISTTGFFDMISYGLQGLWIRLTPFLHPSGQKPFYEYKLERQTKRRSPVASLLIVGAVCIALAGGFLALYYRLR